MTWDPALLHRPTESLILPNKRRFFPLKIPNFHQQLRHYISTIDPDRIYVVVDRVIYLIHISIKKRETVAVIPFEPKCLAAGYGWIAVGGSDNGECAFIKLNGRDVRAYPDSPSVQPSDVDSALPIDLEGPRFSPLSALGEDLESSRRDGMSQLPEVQLHKFGGSIVNSVTIHRLPGDGKSLADEEIVVLSNNDKTVTVYSLVRAKVLKVLHHKACMNYATMSPDSTFLTAVGDETRAYFYHITRDLDATFLTENGEKLSGWGFNLHRCIEMDISTRFDEGCCFTIAFSPSGHLCAIGSQSGVITIFDVDTIREALYRPHDRNAIINHFRSSRSYFDGGAVRCMTFAPEPWDLLVWIEDNGRAGIADVRQDFSRRQILNLDANESSIQQVHTEPMTDDLGLGFELDSRASSDSRNDIDEARRTLLQSVESAESSYEQGGDRRSVRENIVQDPTERERLIVEFLNTARWASRLEEGLTDRRARPNVHQPPTARTRPQGSTDGTTRSPRPTSPLRHETLEDILHGSLEPGGTIDRNLSARRQDSVILSQSNSASHDRTPEDPNSDPQPTITLSWTASPSELQSTSDEFSLNPLPTPGDHGSRSEARGGNLPDDVTNRQLNPSLVTGDMLSRQRSHRSGSTSQRPEISTSETRYEPPRLLNSELRANVAAERLRRQRQLINEAHNRNSQREQRQRQQFLGIEQSRSPRWIRNILNEIPDRSGHGYRDQDPGGTAGIGWGADGRTLYIATVEGIFEYQINIHDRKTFPVFSYR